MTAGEQRLAAWDRHEFMAAEMQNEAGKVVAGSYCQRCSMFAPHGMHLRIKPCRPVAEPETRPGPKVVT